MRSVIFSLSAILTGIGILAMGNGLLSVLVPTKAYNYNLSQISIGMMAGGYYLGFLLGCLFTPRIVERVGHIRSFIAYSATKSVVALAFILMIAPAYWAGLRFVGGFLIAGIYMIAESWVNEFAGNENRGRILSIYRIVDLTALMTGQMLLSQFEIESTMSFVVAGILINLALIPLALTSSVGPRPIRAVRISFADVMNVSKIGAVGCLFVGMVNGSILGLGPVAAAGLSNNSVSFVSTFMATIVLSGAVFQVFVGFFADRFRREYLLLLMAVCASVCEFVFFRRTDWDQTTLMTAVVLLGALAMPLYSLTVAITNDRTETTDFLKIAGGLLLLYGIGASFGPVIASFWMKSFGEKGLFLHASIVHMLIFLFTLYRLFFHRKPVATARIDEFVSPPRTTPVILELDPRAREKGEASP
ncbi:MAG: MFS transporter [Oligoflexales bacterium]